MSKSQFLTKTFSSYKGEKRYSVKERLYSFHDIAVSIPANSSQTLPMKSSSTKMIEERDRVSALKSPLKLRKVLV